MTANELIAQARAHRASGPRAELTHEHIHDALRGLLEALLLVVDYDQHVVSPAALAMRSIASLVGDLEDVRRERLN